jgi:hypothetical protein
MDLCKALRIPLLLTRDELRGPGDKSTPKELSYMRAMLQQQGPGEQKSESVKSDGRRCCATRFNHE